MSKDVVITANWLDSVGFDEKGLVNVVTQDHITKRVLMVAWMNREALEITASTGFATYYSRSRGKLWHKGEESGNQQKIKEIRLDCDGDVLILMVEQVGGIACHTAVKAAFITRWKAHRATSPSGLPKTPC